MKSSMRGSIILEALIAVGIGALFFTAIGSALVVSIRNTGSLFKSEQANWAMDEAITAVRTLNFSDLVITDSAVLAFSEINGSWNIAPGSPELLDGQLTRSISVSEVQRDSSCLIVQSGGDVDSDSYSVQTTVSWNNVVGDAKEVSSTTLVTNWQNPTGSCFLPEASGVISIDTSGAYWGGSKQLRGVTVTNDSSEDVYIDKMTLWWSFHWSLMSQIFIIDTKAWSTSGPGTPLGYQWTGTEIDILDTAVPAGESGDAYKIKFTAPMQWAWVIMEFEFTDG
ncbi:hypothetical protein KJ766_03280 [Patescibacteria group bacterium]|nr:hypothetical protein [Patescibacteria group bacterium]